MRAAVQEELSVSRRVIQDLTDGRGPSEVGEDKAYQLPRCSSRRQHVESTLGESCSVIPEGFQRLSRSGSKLEGGEREGDGEECEKRELMSAALMEVCGA